MDQSAFSLDSAVDSSASDESQCDELPRDDARNETPPPEFGIVDLVEAFTAMRHEWRGQIRESRSLTEAVREAVTTLQELEVKRRAGAGDVPADESRRLAELIADTDHQLTRAIAAVEQYETNRRRRAEANARAVEQSYDGMNALARWFARPLLATLNQLRQADEQEMENPAIEGLNLVLARLRRTMRDHEIERIDTPGREFDASIMNAIGTAECAETPPGHVAEQLSPCYLWRDGPLRFADVRVAAQPSSEGDSNTSVA